ncbi:MAG: ferritin family protein [Candidatus Bipolaricaulota bacterium]
MNERRRDALKGAMLLEQRGQEFYKAAARESEVAEVSKMFQLLANEEAHHQRTLAKAYAELEETGDFSAPALEKAPADVTNNVLTPAVMSEVSAAGYEAAAVYAAMGLEERAIAYYQEQEKAATDDKERKLYNWLSDWEGRHLNALLAMEEDIRQRVWNDQHFWPLL